MIKYPRRLRQQLTPQQSRQLLLDLWRYLNLHNFQKSMQPPRFKISRTRRYLGAYIGFKNSSRGIIILSEQAFNHATDSVFINILLHEMAHQYCAEILKIPSRRHGHGKIWRFVCQACGAQPIKSGRA